MPRQIATPCFRNRSLRCRRLLRTHFRSPIGSPPVSASTRAVSVAGRSGTFFEGRTPGTGPPHPVGRPPPERAFHLPAAPPDGLDVHAGDLREEAVAAVADPHGFQGDVPAALLLVEAAEEEVHPMVKESIGMFRLMKTRGALTPVDDRLRHRCGSLPRDASQRESVSEHVENAE